MNTESFSVPRNTAAALQLLALRRPPLVDDIHCAIVFLRTAAAPAPPAFRWQPIARNFRPASLARHLDFQANCAQVVLRADTAPTCFALRRQSEIPYLEVAVLAHAASIENPHCPRIMI